MNHQETYDSVCQAKSMLLNLMFELIPNTELHKKADEIYQMLKPISDSEHKHIINEIQNQPIAEWKP